MKQIFQDLGNGTTSLADIPVPEVRSAIEAARSKLDQSIPLGYRNVGVVQEISYNNPGIKPSLTCVGVAVE